MAIALKRGSDGELQQIQTGDSIEVDTIERRSGSGNLVVGSGLGTAELQIGSTTGDVRVMNDLIVDGALGGDLNVGSFDIVNVEVFTYDAEFDNGNSGTTKTINWNNGGMQKVTLTGNVTLSFTAPTTGVGRFQLKLIQDGTGGRTVTWPAGVRWPGGTAPTITSAANAVDIVTFSYDGTNYDGVASQNFS